MEIKTILILAMAAFGFTSEVVGQDSRPGFDPYHELKIRSLILSVESGIYYEYVPTRHIGIAAGIAAPSSSRRLDLPFRTATFDTPVLSAPLSVPSLNMRYDFDINFYFLHKRHDKFTLAVGPTFFYLDEDVWVHPDYQVYCERLGGCAEYSRSRSNWNIGPRLSMKGRIWRSIYFDVALYTIIRKEYIDNDMTIRLAWRFVPRKHKVRRMSKKVEKVLPTARWKP